MYIKLNFFFKYPYDFHLIFLKILRILLRDALKSLGIPLEMPQKSLGFSLDRTQRSLGITLARGATASAPEKAAARRGG